MLVKLGEADLGWLAERAVAVTGDDPALAGMAAVAVGQALRALGRGRLALAADRYRRAAARARRVDQGCPRWWSGRSDRPDHHPGRAVTG